MSVTNTSWRQDCAKRFSGGIDCWGDIQRQFSDFLEPEESQEGLKGQWFQRRYLLAYLCHHWGNNCLENIQWQLTVIKVPWRQKCANKMSGSNDCQEDIQWQFTFTKTPWRQKNATSGNDCVQCIMWKETIKKTPQRHKGLPTHKKHGLWFPKKTSGDHDLSVGYASNAY